jgi:CDP-diacylglycerol pyrophosphatase
MIRASKTARFLLAATGLATVTGFTTFAISLDRQALWPVVQACVADYELTTAPFPCLAVDLSGGEENGNVILRPPFTHDLIVSPTRRVVGIEDPFLQSRDAPNYFDAAWRARSFLTDAGGRPPNRDAIALVVNSAFVRIQDQLHIHVGCLFPAVQQAITAVAPQVPLGEWKQLNAVIPHIVFWGTRVQGTDLRDIEPFRLVADAFADKVHDERRMMIMVAAVQVGGQDGFLILASYLGAPHSWWGVGDNELIRPRCPTETGPNE